MARLLGRLAGWKPHPPNLAGTGSSRVALTPQERVELYDTLNCLPQTSVLRQACPPIPRTAVASPENRAIYRELRAAAESEGLLSLAAPQLGHVAPMFCIRRVLVEPEVVPINKHNNPGMQLVMVINPCVTFWSTETTTDFENCTSVPGISGQVTRPDHIDVEYIDEAAVEHFRTLRGVSARVFLHEFDHLQGKLFTDYTKASVLQHHADDEENLSNHSNSGGKAGWWQWLRERFSTRAKVPSVTTVDSELMAAMEAMGVEANSAQDDKGDNAKNSPQNQPAP